MNKIQNISELRSEISRLEEKSGGQKTQIRTDITNLKESFRPLNIVVGILSDITGVKLNKDSFIKDGIVYTISLLIQQVFLKTERKFEKGIYQMVDGLLDKIRKMVTSFSDPEARRRERSESDQV